MRDEIIIAKRFTISVLHSSEIISLDQLARVHRTRTARLTDLSFFLSRLRSPLVSYSYSILRKAHAAHACMYALLITTIVFHGDIMTARDWHWTYGGCTDARAVVLHQQHAFFFRVALNRQYYSKSSFHRRFSTDSFNAETWQQYNAVANCKYSVIENKVLPPYIRYVIMFQSIIGGERTKERGRDGNRSRYCKPQYGSVSVKRFRPKTIGSISDKIGLDSRILEISLFPCNFTNY